MQHGIKIHHSRVLWINKQQPYFIKGNIRRLVYTDHFLMVLDEYSRKQKMDRVRRWNHSPAGAYNLICPAFVLDITTSILWFFQSFTRATLQILYSFQLTLLNKPMGRECSSIHKLDRNWIFFCDAWSTYIQWNEETHKEMLVIRIQLKASNSSDYMETRLN